MWRLVPFLSFSIGSASQLMSEWSVAWLASLLLMALAILTLIVAALIFIGRLNRSHARLLAIAANIGVADAPGGILAADHVLAHLFGRHMPERFDHFHLLIPHRIRGEIGLQEVRERRSG